MNPGIRVANPLSHYSPWFHIARDDFLEAIHNIRPMARQTIAGTFQKLEMSFWSEIGNEPASRQKISKQAG